MTDALWIIGSFLVGVAATCLGTGLVIEGYAWRHYALGALSLAAGGLGILASIVWLGR